MLTMRRRLLAVLAALAVAPLMAAEPRAKEVPPPPPLPPADSATEPDAVEPEITITTRDGSKFEEYRVNGRLYMVKVTPKHGRPYYLLYDEAGRQRRSDLEPDTVVPSWVIKRF